MKVHRLFIGLVFLLALQSCDTGTGSGSSTASSTSSSTSSSSGSYTLSDGSSVSSTNASYSSSTGDVSAIYVLSGTLSLTSPTIVKSGDVSSSDGCKKGLNAAVLASSSNAAISLVGGSITSSAVGGNAGFAYNGATLNLSGTTISCSGSGECRALYATYGGVITATGVSATTSGKNSSAVATDMGGGTIVLSGGTFKASGTDSAGLYSTGTITASSITAASEQGEACVIEGSNSISVTGSSVLSSAASSRGILILQSGSGDATGYNASFTMTGGTLTTSSTTVGSSSTSSFSVVPAFEVTTNTTGTITLTDVTLSIASGALMVVDKNTRWSTSGATGKLVLSTAKSSWSPTGNILADGYSSATVTVNAGVNWTGAFNTANSAKSGTVTVSSGGTWTLSGDSYVTTLVNEGSIVKNGYTLTAASSSGGGTIN